MSDVEQRKSRRLQFLTAVYDLADGTTGNPVRGEDVAERLGISLHGDEFHGLARFHEQEGNTQALETNWETFLITAKGITEAERAMTPESRQEMRERLLKAIYDLSNGNPAEFVYWQHVAPRLGFGAETARPPNGVMAQADHLADSGLITIEVDEGTVYRITANGIDAAEGKKPEGQQPSVSTVFNISGNVYSSVIGTHNTAELTSSFDFRAIEQRIEREGGEDKEELKRALAQVERLLERGEYLDRGALAQFSGAMERHSWFTGAVMQALLGFATQMAG